METSRGVAGEPVVIKVRNNGPYKVTGPITLIDADGNEFDLPEGDGIVLCRCGASTTKPFCDKTHSKIGFEAAERAVREARPRRSLCRMTRDEAVAGSRGCARVPTRQHPPVRGSEESGEWTVVEASSRPALQPRASQGVAR